jgi:hypothetical protein
MCFENCTSLLKCQQTCEDIPRKSIKEIDIKYKGVIKMIVMKTLESDKRDNLVEFKEKIEELYFRVPINDIIMKIVEGLHKIKNSQVKEYSHELKYEVTVEERIRAEPIDYRFSTVEELKSAFSSSQIQLFIYLLSIWKENGGANEFFLEAKDYFSKRGIAVRKASKDRLERDLTVLSTVSLQLQAKRKKEIEYIDAQLIEYEKIRRGFYKIHFGSWIEHISYGTFTLLHKNFFKYHPGHDSVAILLSLKLTQLAKLQFAKPLPTYSIKFNTLFSLLGISECQIRKQGYKHYFNQLESVFQRMKIEMGFSIKIEREEGNFTMFMQNKLYYEQSDLKQFYKK